MTNPALIDHAFEDLSQSLRVLLEAHIRATTYLLPVDRAEAVGNIENALSSVLNSFHSLYDAIASNVEKPPINWYQNGPLATIIAIRNARHHNKGNKIRTLYTYHAQEASEPTSMVQYVLVNFPAQEEGASTFEVYMSWSDFDKFLSLPQKERRLGNAACELIRSYLRASKFESYAAHFDLPASRVFFNVVPIIVNAAATIVPLIDPYIRKLSVESNSFAILFSDMQHANMAKPEVDCGPFALPS